MSGFPEIDGRQMWFCALHMTAQGIDEDCPRCKSDAQLGTSSKATPAGTVEFVFSRAEEATA